MIGFLSGKIKFKLKDSILVECSGVGYKVEMDTKRFEIGDEVEFFIYTYVREDAIKLFGFKTADGLKLFESLIGVNGVGPKVGMDLVNELGIDRIVSAILEKKPEMLKIKGVGVKTSEKIVLDLSDKLEKLGFSSSGTVTGQKEKDKLEEVYAALEALGYRRRDCKKALDKISGEMIENNKVENLVKLVLRNI